MAPAVAIRWSAQAGQTPPVSGSRADDQAVVGLVGVAADRP